MTNLTDRVVHVALWGLARGLLWWSLVPTLWLLWSWFQEQPPNTQVHYLRVAAIGFALLWVAKEFIWGYLGGVIDVIEREGGLASPSWITCYLGASDRNGIRSRLAALVGVWVDRGKPRGSMCRGGTGRTCAGSGRGRSAGRTHWAEKHRTRLALDAFLVALLWLPKPGAFVLVSVCEAIFSFDSRTPLP